MKINFLLPSVNKLFGMLSAKHRVYWGMLIVLTVGYSLIETLGISAIMPFISIASNSALLDTGMYKKAFDFFGPQDKETFIIYFGAAIIVFYVFRSVYSITHTWLINRFSMGVNRLFSEKLFQRILSIPYFLYVQKNSGDLIGLINGQSRRIGTVAINVMQLFTELFTIILIYAVLLFVNWKMTLLLTVILVVMSVIFLRFLVAKNKSLGKKRAESDMKTYRILTEAFGNFKFIRLKGTKNELLSVFDSAMRENLQTEVTSSTLNVMPKNVLESLGFSILIAAVMFILARYHNAAVVIPVISMYALALYRILPSMHRMLQNVNNIAFAQHSLDLVDESLRLPVEDEGTKPVSFEKTISLRNVSFTYASGNEVIHSVSLTINKGEKIAFTGKSGSGKSTLADLIIGMHKPVSGSLCIDDTVINNENIASWRQKIGYIPQSIYLFDGTVADNIAIGSVADNAKIITAFKTANIWEFLESKEGIYTRVGEGGIQLSGGQQQRIGIARALYNDPEILVLDEATSALDTETESKIMNEIYSVSKNKTLIVIAHRLSTVERCDRKIIIEEGRIEN